MQEDEGMLKHLSELLSWEGHISSVNMMAVFLIKYCSPLDAFLTQRENMFLYLLSVLILMRKQLKEVLFLKKNLKNGLQAKDYVLLLCKPSPFCNQHLE